MMRQAEDSAGEPTAMEAVRAVAGEEALVRLSIAFGGTAMKIPARTPVRHDHPLVTAVGQEAADAIARELGGLYIHFPNSAGIRAQIHAAADAGMTARQIAQLVKRSMRHVYQVLREPRGIEIAPRRDDRQLDMFG